jgi:hypothetical protein
LESGERAKRINNKLLFVLLPSLTGVCQPVIDLRRATLRACFLLQRIAQSPVYPSCGRCTTLHLPRRGHGDGSKMQPTIGDG